jgi:hypothetical protein
VNAPFSWPNNSLSIKASGKAAALIATKGQSQRGLNLWISLATNSFPVPVSPQINTGAEVGATCRIVEKICCIAGDMPTISPEYTADRHLRLKLGRFRENSLMPDNVVPKRLGRARLCRSFQKRKCSGNGEKRLGLPVRHHGLSASLWAAYTNESLL